MFPISRTQFRRIFLPPTLLRSYIIFAVDFHMFIHSLITCHAVYANNQQNKIKNNDEKNFNREIVLIPH